MSQHWLLLCWKVVYLWRSFYHGHLSPVQTLSLVQNCYTFMFCLRVVSCSCLYQFIFEEKRCCCCCCWWWWWWWCVCVFQPSSSSSSSPSSSVIDSTFIQHMDSGLWFVSVYNDGDAPRTLSFTAAPHGQSQHYVSLTECFICPS